MKDRSPRHVAKRQKIKIRYRAAARRFIRVSSLYQAAWSALVDEIGEERAWAEWRKAF